MKHSVAIVLKENYSDIFTKRKKSQVFGPIKTSRFDILKERKLQRLSISQPNRLSRSGKQPQKFGETEADQAEQQHLSVGGCRAQEAHRQHSSGRYMMAAGPQAWISLDR